MNQCKKKNRSNTQGRRKRISGLGMVIVIVMQLFPTITFGIELNLRDYFRSQVDRSDNFMKAANIKVNQNLQNTTELITKLTRGGFSILEKRTGLEESNKLYKSTKNAALRKTGIKIGVANGTKDLVMGTASLLAQLNTLPARTIGLAYNVKEKPQQYKDKFVTGAGTVAGLLLNPFPVLDGIYQSGKSKLAEAQQDPLEMGKLQGEVAVFGGSLLIGGGQAKSLNVVNKIKNTALAGNIAKVPAIHLPQINLGLGSALPVGAGAGKGITAKSYKISSSIEASSIVSYERTGRISNVETSAVANYPYPIIEINRYDSLLKTYNLEYDWIRGLCAPKAVREKLVEWGETTFEKWKYALSKEEQVAINEYTYGSRRVNAVLRGIDKQYTGESLDKIELISNGLQKSVLPEMLLFRGAGKRFLGDLADMSPENLIGKTFEEKGFLSTSLFPQEHFIDGVQMVIKVPRGINGAYLGDLSKFKREAEVLLDHGQKMLIREVKPKIDGIWDPDGLHMVVEVLPKLKP